MVFHRFMVEIFRGWESGDPLTKEQGFDKNKLQRVFLREDHSSRGYGTQVSNFGSFLLKKTVLDSSGNPGTEKPSHQAIFFLGDGWYTKRKKQRSKNLPLKAMLVVGRRDSLFHGFLILFSAYFSGRVLGCPWKVYTLFTGLTTYFYRGYNPFTKYQQDIPESQ